MLETPSALLSPGTFGRAVLCHESEHLRAPKTLAVLHPLPLGGRPLQYAERQKGSWGRDVNVSPRPSPGHRSVITSPQGGAHWECHTAQQHGVPAALLPATPSPAWPQAFRAPLPCPAALLGLCPGSRPAHTRPCGIRGPNSSLTVGWTLGRRAARLEFFPGEAPSPAQ